MFVKEINIYVSFESWLQETPDAVIKGSINNRFDNCIEILDENGLTQIINMGKLYAIVY